MGVYAVKMGVSCVKMGVRVLQMGVFGSKMGVGVVQMGVHAAKMGMCVGMHWKRARDDANSAIRGESPIAEP